MPRILHVCRKPLGGQPAWISEMQRRAGWESKVLAATHRATGKRPYPVDLKPSDRAEIRAYCQGVNVVHLHDDMTPLDELAQFAIKACPSSAVVVHQLYHERSLIPQALRREAGASGEFACVNADKASLLEPDLPNLPVVVPFWREELRPIIRQRAKLRVVWTPANMQRLLAYSGSTGKGYQETKPILERVAKRFDVRVITDLNWRETMLACQDADIRLDELVTGGYGMPTIEALSQGCVAMGGLRDDVAALFPTVPPVARVTFSNLEQVLDGIATMSWSERQSLMEAGPAWIQQHYSERILHAAYETFYRRCGEGRDPLVKRHPSPKVYRVVAVKDVETPREKDTIHAEVPPEAAGGSLIVQVARTNCAGAIWRIHDAINRYTGHRCRTITWADHTNGRRFPRDVLMADSGRVRDLLAKADVVHFHNWVDQHSPEMQPYQDLLRGKRMLIQYHTEPKLLQPNFRANVVERTDIPTLAIAQKHARFFPRSIPVPNLIDVEAPLATPAGRVWDGASPLKVIWTPTDLKSYPDYTGTCCGKGYQECLPILRRLEADGVIELTIITDMGWEELMSRKRQHDVCLDEVVTGGYHLCSLEALSQGLVTVAWLDEATQRAVASVAGPGELPWYQATVATLDARIRALKTMGAAKVAALKAAGRRFMVERWHPSLMVRHYLKAYGVEAGAQRATVIAPDQRPRYFRRQRMLPIYNVPEVITPEARALKGRWVGVQAVIWGNGPTVEHAMRTKPWVEGAAHIGTNAATLIPGVGPELTFDAYCIGDTRFLQKAEKLQIARNAPGVRIYQSVLRRFLPKEDHVAYVRTIGAEGFSPNILDGVFHGYSVAWLALQVAVYAGSTDVLLAGCPFNYGKQPRFYAEAHPSPVDNNWSNVARCWRAALPFLRDLGVTVRTIGPSRLAEVGVPEA